MTQAWNPAQTATGIVLSGGNLIATGNANAGITFALESVSTGRYYWEITVATTALAGIGNTSSPFTTGNFPGDTSATTLGWYQNGSLFFNNATLTTWNTYASGNTIAFAMDLSSVKLWGRVGAAGNWNNDVIGNQNPAVGSQIGGLGISGVTGSPVVPMGYANAVNDVVTGKFDSGSWIGTPPTGFGPFDVAAGPGVGRALLLGVGGSIVRRDFRPIRALLGGRES